MEDVVKDKADDNQPVPVSDDEEDYCNGKSQETTVLRNSLAEINSDGNHTAPRQSTKDISSSPRENFISPASSPFEPDSPEATSKNGNEPVNSIADTNVLDNCVDDVSVEDGDNDERDPALGSDDACAAAVNVNNAIDNHNDVENVSASPSGSPQQNVVDDVSIANEMHNYIKINRINWGEIEQVEDLWAICDAVSAAHSGLPDSLLKDSFLIVLQSYMTNSKVGWMRQHLDYLVKLWKKEVQSEKAMERSTKFVAACSEYTPPVVVKKRRPNAAKKRALKALMGVGDILQQARVRFATEKGELDVEEDEHGAYTIGGQELSFESWANITRIKDDGVVCDPQALAMTRRPKKRKASNAQQMMNQTVQHGMTSFVASPASSSVLESTRNVSFKSSSVKASKKQESKQEKDEGELSESDDSAADSDSASSSSSDEDVTALRAKIRRKKRRESQRQAGVSSMGNINDIMQKAFQYRFQISHALTIQQKAAFLECLKQNMNTATNSRVQPVSQVASSLAGYGVAAGSPSANQSITFAK